MVHVALSTEDAAILRETLGARLIDLKREIAHTDSPRFRGTLHQVEDALERLLEQLPPEIDTRASGLSAL